MPDALKEEKRNRDETEMAEDGVSDDEWVPGGITTPLTKASRHDQVEGIESRQQRNEQKGEP